jgi:hypothetical protein
VNFSIGSTHFKVSLGTLAGLAFGLFLFFRFGQGGSAALDKWLGSGPVEIATDRKLLAQDSLHQAQASRRWRKLSDSLGTILATARALQTRGEGLASEAVTAPQMREAARVLAQANQVCMDGLTLCKHRGDSLFTADSAHADSLHQGLARATTSIATGVAAAECHLVHLGPIKLFGCPDRWTAAKIGAVGGVGLVEFFRILLTGKP